MRARGYPCTGIFISILHFRRGYSTVKFLKSHLHSEASETQSMSFADDKTSSVLFINDKLHKLTTSSLNKLWDGLIQHEKFGKGSMANLLAKFFVYSLESISCEELQTICDMIDSDKALKYQEQKRDISSLCLLPEDCLQEINFLLTDRDVCNLTVVNKQMFANFRSKKFLVSRCDFFRTELEVEVGNGDWTYFKNRYAQFCVRFLKLSGSKDDEFDGLSLRWLQRCRELVIQNHEIWEMIPLDFLFGCDSKLEYLAIEDYNHYNEKDISLVVALLKKHLAGAEGKRKELKMLELSDFSTYIATDMSEFFDTMNGNFKMLDLRGDLLVYHDFADKLFHEQLECLIIRTGRRIEVIGGPEEKTKTSLGPVKRLEMGIFSRDWKRFHRDFDTSLIETLFLFTDGNSYLMPLDYRKPIAELCRENYPNLKSIGIDIAYTGHLTLLAEMLHCLLISLDLQKFKGLEIELMMYGYDIKEWKLGHKLAKQTEALETIGQDDEWWEKKEEEGVIIDKFNILNMRKVYCYIRTALNNMIDNNDVHDLTFRFTV